RLITRILYFCLFFLRVYLFSFSLFCFFMHPATTEIYTLSLHDALPISSILMRRGSVCTSLEEESCRPALFMSINRQMLTTTRSWGRSRRGEVLAPLSGCPNSIAITSLLQRMKEQLRRFWYTHPGIEG